MTLEDWLTRAGLTGKKLEQAVKGCDTNTVETIADLVELTEDKELFKDVIPQGMVRSAILKALKGGPQEQKAIIQIEASPRYAAFAFSHADDTHNQSSRIQKPTTDDELPHGKRYVVVVQVLVSVFIPVLNYNRKFADPTECQILRTS